MSTLAVIAFDVRCYDACRFTRGAGHPSGVPWRQAFDAWEWYFQFAAAVFGTVAATAALYLALRRQRGAAVFVAPPSSSTPSGGACSSSAAISNPVQARVRGRPHLLPGRIRDRHTEGCGHEAWVFSSFA